MNLGTNTYSIPYSLLYSAPYSAPYDSHATHISEHIHILLSSALWIHLERSTSSMHAIVLLQTVCKALVCGHRDFPNNIADLSTWRGILVRD